MDILLSPGQLITIMGIPTAVTAFCFWLIERRIQKRDKKKEEEAAERAKAAKAAAEKKEKEEAQREAAREQMQILTIQMTNAAIALGEATAKAVQRIPDAQCNGDMHAALDYAAKVKHEQKEFLTSIGIKSILE
jgi:flagellar biosynthesis component FlhA